MIYDLLSNTWKQGAECPNLISYRDFACCASPEGLIYTAGQLDTTHGVVCEASVYKVDEEKWEILPNMNQNIGLSKCVFMNGMFYVIGFPEEGTQRFDPNTGVWETIDNMSQYHEDAFHAFGRLLAYQIGSIDEFDWEENVWKQLDPIPEHLEFNLATVWGDGIFFGTDIPPLIFYIYRPEAALSDKWAPVTDNLPADVIMCMTTIEM